MIHGFEVIIPSMYGNHYVSLVALLHYLKYGLLFQESRIYKNYGSTLSNLQTLPKTLVSQSVYEGDVQFYK